MDICHLENSELELQYQKYKGRVVLREDIVKMILDLVQYSLNKDRQRPKWQPQKSWVTQYPLIRRSKWKMHQRYSKFRSQNVQMLGYVYQKHKWPKSWSSIEDPVFLLERNLLGHPLARLLWESQFEKVLFEHGWEKVPHWECLFVNREKGLFFSVYVDDINLDGKTQDIDPMWKMLMKNVDLGEPTSFLDHAYSGCTQRECQTSKDVVDKHRNMLESRISVGALEKASLFWETWRKHFLMVLWLGRSCKEMCGAILRAGEQNDSTVTQSRWLQNQEKTCQKNAEVWVNEWCGLRTNQHTFFSRESQLNIFEVNEAVIKMIIKGRSPTVRDVSRTLRFALDWLFDRINLGPKIQIKFVHIKKNNSQTC